jgi:hypothetical protein
LEIAVKDVMSDISTVYSGNCFKEFNAVRSVSPKSRRELENVPLFLVLR